MFDNYSCLSLGVKNVSYSYTKNSPMVLNNLTFYLKKGETVAIVGSNGCGKTTLLNLIAGFLKPDSGHIKYYDNETNPFFTSMAFQNPSLLEWKTVSENIAVSLLNKISDPETRNKIVDKYLTLLQIHQHKHKLPCQLSGGLKQRTVIARALAANPELLLLDESFSALNLHYKENLQKDLLKIIHEEKKSVLIVTHSLGDSILFADRIMLLDSKTGRIHEIIEVDLPKPRTPKIKNSRKFIKIKSHLRETIESLEQSSRNKIIISKQT